MKWFKEKYEAIMVTVTILGGIITAVIWLNSQFTAINEKTNIRLTAIEKDLTIIKTVLVMKGIVPTELAHHEHDKQ